MDAVNGKVSGSFAEYAKHRGVSKAAVSKTRKKEWFAPAVAVRDGKEYIADFALADRLWEHHADPTRASAEAKERMSRIVRSSPPSDEPPAAEDAGEAGEGGEAPELSLAMSYTDAAKADKYWSAMKKKQDFELTAKLLVSAKDAGDAAVALVVLSRTKMLGIPSKLKALIPELSHGQLATIDRLIRESMQELDALASDVSPEVAA
jgi:hypothetical protein